ncbi:MAG: molybdopterin-dependent oxidoreductase, partial [Actinomycetota bacterium]
MNLQRARIFRLIETADNFVKYARPGGYERAAVRARKRYNRAGKLAESVGDAEMIEQVRLRLADLDQRATVIGDETGDGDVAEALDLAPDPAAEERVPPGQTVTRGWPVLHEGRIPRFDPATWSMSIDGACRNEIELSYEELRSIGPIETTSDFHCVTGWTKLDNTWTGIQTKTLLARAEPSPEAIHVLVHAEYGYTANLPLEVLRGDDALVAWGHNGRD